MPFQSIWNLAALPALRQWAKPLIHILHDAKFHPGNYYLGSGDLGPQLPEWRHFVGTMDVSTKGSAGIWIVISALWVLAIALIVVCSASVVCLASLNSDAM